MIIFSVLTVALILLWLWATKADFVEGSGFLCLLGLVTVSVLLVIALGTLPLSYYGTFAEIEQFNSVQITLNTARENGSDLEDAAMQIEVMKSNSWLANKKYWNTTIFDLWIPDAINKLEPIK